MGSVLEPLMFGNSHKARSKFSAWRSSSEKKLEVLFQVQKTTAMEGREGEYHADHSGFFD